MPRASHVQVEHALSRVFANDRVTQASRQPVPPEVKGVVVACYLEHKRSAYVALIGIFWLVRGG